VIRLFCCLVGNGLQYRDEVQPAETAVSIMQKRCWLQFNPWMILRHELLGAILPEKPKSASRRRSMRLSIRDVMLVTVIVALAAGWIVDNRTLAPDAHRYREAMKLWTSPESPTSQAPAPNPPKP
jgi:hypothetical protein